MTDKSRVQNKVVYESRLMQPGWWAAEKVEESVERSRSVDAKQEGRAQAGCLERACRWPLESFPASARAGADLLLGNHRTTRPLKTQPSAVGKSTSCLIVYSI